MGVNYTTSKDYSMSDGYYTDTSGNTYQIQEIYWGSDLVWQLWKDVYYYNKGLVDSVTWSTNTMTKHSNITGSNSTVNYNTANITLYTGSGTSAYNEISTSTKILVPKHAVYLNVALYTMNSLSTKFDFGLSTTKSYTLNATSNPGAFYVNINGDNSSGYEYGFALASTTSKTYCFQVPSKLLNTTQYLTLYHKSNQDSSATSSNGVRVTAVWFSKTKPSGATESSKVYSA